MVGPRLAPLESLPADLTRIASRVEDRLRTVLSAERERWTALDPSLTEPIASLEALVLSGGKRLRPAFCHWGFVAAGGDPDDPQVVDAGAAFELLQGFALVHDDVMDGSATRRGRPAVHRQFIDRHEAEQWVAEPRRFGEGVAILVGDLAFVYADRMLPTGSPEATALWHELRIELNVGQYLDLVGTATSRFERRAARRIARYKSGKYTIERPLQVGAALAGGGALVADLSRYGDPLGEGFQLRDDVLGVFGDESLTGKPVGDDLREGKPTLLLAVAREQANAAGQDLLGRVGDPELSEETIADLQALLVRTGALAAVEASIDERVEEALAALASLGLAPTAAEALEGLAHVVVRRDA